MIYVTRHGQTDWNVQKKVMGRCDEPLNETGLQQAEETRNNLLNTKIDIIICSPLQRAKQTAEVINTDRNIPIIYDDRIITCGCGFSSWKLSSCILYSRCKNFRGKMSRV